MSATGYAVKELEDARLPEALGLVREVFLEFEAPEYSDEGTEEFMRFIELSSIADMRAKSEILLWGCFDGHRIVGVIAAHPRGHINLLFVDKAHHRRGVARALYGAVLEHFKESGGCSEITVNSSPYAVEAYRRLGFSATDGEQVVNGIRFTPMRHVFR